MSVYVLFMIVVFDSYRSTASFNYEFKDRIQCEEALRSQLGVWSKERFAKPIGYCQEVRK